MDVKEFLLARIAEDEEHAGRFVDLFPEGDMAPLFRRVLAECAAKRAIIEAHDLDDRRTDLHVSEPLLGILAAVYSDHPDYQEEWSL